MSEKQNAYLATIAELGKRDLFFLLVYLLKREDCFNDWVFDRCKEVQASPNGHLDLWAREHYKSTIITFALTIQDILNNPEITIGIFSHTRPIAKGFLKQIKAEFEQNELLKACYPDVLYDIPHKEAPQWAEDCGIIVKRKNNPKEATLEAWGLVDGQPTGKHFSLLIYDDVVTRESVSTPEMIAKVTEAWALSLNLGARGGERRYIGTRYHFNDTYKIMLERKAANPRIYPATDNGEANGQPHLLSKADLEQKYREMGAYVFGCQMLQNPTADKTQGFKEEWLKYADVEANHRIKWQGMNIYLLCDPAQSKKQGSDYSVFAVIGLGQDGNYYLVDGVRDRLNLTERTNTLFKLHREYRPLDVGYERYGMQADIEHIKFMQENQGYRFNITELGGAMPKVERIRQLVPIFEQGLFYLPSTLLFIDVEGKARNFTHEFVEEEYKAFPVSSHDDMLDCIARILDPKMCAVFPRLKQGASRQKAKNDFSLWN
nr:hypothetical protein [Desulfovibrio litoralis]